MTSSFTPNKHIEKPAHNDYVDTWEVPVNADMTIIDTALGGTTSLSVTSQSGTITLTSTQYTPLILKISGTLTANVTYAIPSTVGGIWVVQNTTTGAFNVIISNAGAGTSITTVQGGTTILVSDGTNIFQGVNQSQISTAMAPVVAAATVLAAFNLLAASGGMFGGNVTITGNETITGTQGVGGLTTLTGGANFASLAASSLVATDGSKNATAIAPGSSGQALISTGTAWTSGTPSGTLVVGTPAVMNPFVAASTVTTPHTLGAKPNFTDCYIECLSGEQGFATGEQISLVEASQSADGRGITYSRDAANCTISTGSALPSVVPGGGGSSVVTLTPAKWKVVIQPWGIK